MFLFFLIYFLRIVRVESSLQIESSPTILSTTKAIQYGIGRLTNGSLGEYDFIRSDCLHGNVLNKLNQTTVLPSLVAKILNPSTTSCLRGNGKIFSLLIFNFYYNHAYMRLPFITIQVQSILRHVIFAIYNLLLFSTSSTTY